MKFKAGIKVSSGGLYATHWLGAKLFAGYISGSATMSIAAPVAACAFGTAAAVYFIPWGSLISWIKRAVSKIWSLLGSVWNWLKERFSTFSTAAEDLPPPYRPMEFAS
ncbi:hypothetical protein N8T08_007440 [Aspergillus melleus]|uniref:Uncharacterized protein n=1 Tax=Aspergillus melleus TaxID=138277 RepID=A0ACC3AXR3_9EURO|nr:hypothetical protein N8T08_007440 [Aspergillus melleus]